MIKKGMVIAGLMVASLASAAWFSGKGSGSVPSAKNAKPKQTTSLEDALMSEKRRVKTLRKEHKKNYDTTKKRLEEMSNAELLNEIKRMLADNKKALSEYESRLAALEKADFPFSRKKLADAYKEVADVYEDALDEYYKLLKYAIERLSTSHSE